MTTTPVIDAAPEGADVAVRVQLDAVRELLQGLPQQLVGVASSDLAALAASAAGVVAAAEAARAAVVLEAHARGVIAASDHPRTRDWVAQSCREGGVPVVRAQTRQLQDITADCGGYDVAALRDAVTAGQVATDAAADIARVFRRLKKKTDYGNWDKLLAALIDWAAGGADQRELATIEDLCLSQYGIADALDDEHSSQRERRMLTYFRRDRAGMLSATVKLDPASEAAFTAAIEALAKPQPDPDGPADLRSVGQRRADALLTLARLATAPDKEISGTGSAARVIVTVPLTTLQAGLDLGERLGEYADAGSAAEAAPRNAADGVAGQGEPSHGVGGFGQVLSPREARMLACDAQIIPAVLGSKGQLLDLGGTKRLITPRLRDYLHARDRGCTYPGCSAPPSWCDGHHIIHWSRGGPTDRDNLALLCRHHHTVVHRHDHTATIDDLGVHWTRRDGTAIGNTARGG